MDTMQISLPPPSADPERGGPPPHYPLWSPKCLLWIGILTSFVFSGVMQGINYGRMGQPRRRKTWIIGSVLGFLALETLLWIVPEVYIPLLVNLLINTIIAVFVGIQGLRDFRAHESAGGKRAPGGLPIACVSASCLILVVLLGAGTLIGYVTNESRAWKMPLPISTREPTNQRSPNFSTSFENIRMKLTGTGISPPCMRIPGSWNWPSPASKKELSAAPMRLKPKVISAHFGQPSRSKRNNWLNWPLSGTHLRWKANHPGEKRMRLWTDFPTKGSASRCP